MPFTVLTQAKPTIGSIAPTSGKAGDVIVITGAGFTNVSSVKFNGAAASFTVDSATQIMATVPQGASSGPLTVTTPGGTASTSFSVTGGSGSAIAVLDEGVQLTTQATAFNFVGAGVEASESGEVVTVTIPGGTGGSLPTRQTATINIPSLANDATANITIPLAKGFTIYRVDTSIPYRVRLYSSTGYRTADAARAIGTDPSGDHGVILDTVTTSGKLFDSGSPYPTGVNLEATPSTDIAAAITNKSGSTQAGTVTIVYLPEES